MRRFSIASFVFFTYLLVALAGLAAIALFSMGIFRQVYHDRLTDGLEGHAKLLAHIVEAPLASGDYESLQRLCLHSTDQLQVRATVVRNDGRVVADSEYDPAAMENHGNRPEVREALKSGKGEAVRLSATLNTDLFYYTLPVYAGDRLLGVVRLSLPVERAFGALRLIYLRVLVGVLAVGLAAFLVSLLISRTLRRATEKMTAGGRRFAGGEFSELLETPRLAEAAALSGALNEMAMQIDERLRAVTKERNQQEAVLSSMVEGVLAVDTQGRIMTSNQAAIRLTGVDFERHQNAFLDEIAPKSPLSEFIRHILHSASPRESEFGNVSRGENILQAHGSVLRDARGNGIGAVVVLNDVTRLRRLEQVRRDFVANVSHELRTPITSIKGFVETLLDGALENAQDANRFLEIIAKQADRLNAILADLLILSRIEEGEEKASITFETTDIGDTVAAAVQLCSLKAAAKNIPVHVDCPAGIIARINTSLFEQAMVNLIDNAIKYSPSGSEVHVRALCRDGVIVQVEDRGCGVAAEHLPRLFERFYRVDKARSRSLGGTGLGLAIVKHVITAHGGRVSVESRLGQGSTFSIVLPSV